MPKDFIQNSQVLVCLDTIQCQKTELRIMIHTEVHYAWDIPTSFLYVPLPILDVSIQALLYHLLYISWGEFQASVVTTIQCQKTELRIMIHSEVHCAWDIPTSFLYFPVNSWCFNAGSFVSSFYISCGEFQASVVTYNLRSLHYEGWRCECSILLLVLPIHNISV